jgi:hypothetical protein
MQITFVPPASTAPNLASFIRGSPPSTEPIGERTLLHGL